MVDKILSKLEYDPLRGQLLLVNALVAFTQNRGPRDVFVINGYAGTGKTSIIGAYVKTLTELGKKVVVLAPTGRAAKVAAQFSSLPASTIHKRIFRADTNAPGAHYFTVPNLDTDTIFIADEASLITDNPYSGNSLLKLLVNHVYSGRGCNLIMVGDTAQLPPVGQSDSPAMEEQRLRSLNLNPFMFSLDEPARQAAQSGILHNSYIVRKHIEHGIVDVPQLEVSSFPDMEVISSRDLAESLSTSWARVGIEETLIITRSNRRANNFNRAIRQQVMMAEEPLERGDRLIISKNDYYWSKENKLGQFLANGEMAIVDWVGKTEKKYGRFFTDVELSIPSSDLKLGAKIHLRSLIAEGASLPEEEMNRFYNHVLAEQEGDSLSHQIKAAVADPWYNALQVKYGYCVTCHKAQGGQWKHIYIDMGNIDTTALTEDFFRWLYTALTRATEKVFLINPTVNIK